MRLKPIMIEDGYVVVINREHPQATLKGKIRQHRLVYEEYHKCCLLPWTDVHHLNGKRDDNRIENLEAMMHGQHTKITHRKDYSNRICDKCGSNKTFVYKNGRPLWAKNPDNKLVWLCHTCYEYKRKHRI